MKRPRSRRWIDLILCSLFLQVELNVTVLNTIVMGPYRCNAALNTQTGEIHGRTAERHTSEEFVAFLAQIVAGQPRNREIHIIADNLSAHKTERVRQFLADHKRVHIHYTPTYSSWLNQVEIWFSKIERDVIARGIFTSKQDLRRKLMRYIKAHNKDPKPYKWSWNDTAHRISCATTSTVTVH